jgi:rod shape-determining protein MreD
MARDAAIRAGGRARALLGTGVKGFLAACVAVALAVAATVSLESAFPVARESVDFFLIVVVYYAITRSRSKGIIMGAFAGLVQDVFASRFLGFHAFVKTAIAYLIGGMGAKFMLNQPFPQFLALMIASLLDAGVSALLSFTAGLPQELGPGALARRALFNSVAGLLIYRVAQRRRTQMAWRR